MANICVSTPDSISIFHASAALGEARYSTASATTNRTREFTWGGRTPEEQSGFWSRNRWIATTVTTGQGPITEFAVALNALPNRPQIAVGFAAIDQPMTIFAWPDEARRGCASEMVLFGNAPPHLTFNPEGWAQLILKQ
jgi:hypothetical protein